jgi:DNA-directed RNA polymerase specialized sigma24 family protein
MVFHESKPEGLPARGVRFETTHWSMVVSAGRDRSPEASRALATLCQNYWFPLYAFVRRAGYSAEDAQDLTQEFFVGLLTKNYLAVADHQRGRFRSFLLGAMKHFLAKHERRQGAQKRGGHSPLLSLDFNSGEDCYRRLEPVDNLTPERLYQKRWALALLDLVFRRLREEFLAAKMRLLNPSTRRLIPIAVFAVLLCVVASRWIMMHFVLRDAQYRSLDPQYYIVQVVPAADYRNLADPANREVRLSDGTTIRKAPIWDEVVLPNYRPTDDGQFYVRVTTKGTAHVLPYVDGDFLLFGFVTACGLLISVWNLRLKS